MEALTSHLFWPSLAYPDRLRKMSQSMSRKYGFRVLFFFSIRQKATVAFRVDLIWPVLDVVAAALVTASECEERNFECSE